MPDKNLDVLVRILTEKVGPEDASAILNQYKAATGEVSKASEDLAAKANVSHYAMRRLAHTMGSEIPGASALMEAGFELAAEPMMGATFLLIGGIEMLRNAIEHLNAEKKDAVRISNGLADADAKHSTVINSQREALERAEVAEAEFHHNFVRNTRNAIDAAESLASAILKAAASRDDGESGKRKDIADKEIEGMEERGVVSHATALKMKEALDIQYEQQKMIRMMAQDKLEEGLLARTLGQKQEALKTAEGTEKKAEAAFESAAQAKAANEQKAKEAQARIDAGEEAKKALREKGVDEVSVERLREFTRKAGGNDSANLSDQYTAAARQNLENIALVGPLIAKTLAAGKIVSQFGEYGDQNLATYTGANIDVTAGKADLARANKKQAGLDITEGNAKSDLDFARQEMEKDREAMQRLQEKITETHAANSIKEGGAQENLGLEKANAALGADRTTADALRAGGFVSNAAAQKLMADATRIAGHNVDLKTAAQIIENGADNMAIFMNQLNSLGNAFAKLDPRQLAQMQRQIDEINAKMNTAK